MQQEKLVKLDLLKKEMEADDLPLKGEANLVFGEGHIDSLVMFIGEAPGAKENEQKRPFVGRSGKLLNQLLEEIGWKRENVYITNIVKRRPPENRDPLPEEIEAYKPYLARQIEIINPKVIAPLGRFAMNYFLPFTKISHDHGKVFEGDGPTSQGYGGARKIIFPLYHPAAALRSTSVMNDLRADFHKLPKAHTGEIAFETVSIDPSVIKTSPEKEKPKQEPLFG